MFPLRLRRGKKKVKVDGKGKIHDMACEKVASTEGLTAILADHS